MAVVSAFDPDWIRLPWHDALWPRLAPRGGSTHHALLLRGPSGIGKARLARALAAALLCQSPLVDQSACGDCDSCRWLAAGNHPDFRRLTSAAQLQDEGEDSAESAEPAAAASERKASQQITIEQVRALGGFFALTTHRGGARVLLVEPADALNPAAANALLKTLEEPPPATRFLLVTSHPRRLAPTILSRCLPIALPVPAPEVACAWLAAQGLDRAAQYLTQAAGRPLHALAQADDAVQSARRQFLEQLAAGDIDPHGIADKAARESVVQWTEWMQTWCHDLMVVQAGGAPRFHLEQQQALQRLARHLDAGRLMDWEMRLRSARYEARQPVNARLFCDDLLMGYRRLFA